MLSRCFHEVGFDILAVDHSHNRFHPLAHICNLDLTEDASWEFLAYVVRHYPVCFVHVAPPCGTCSRAREINLVPSTFQPRPLRSEEQPHGLPGLTDDDQKRVDAVPEVKVFDSLQSAPRSTGPSRIQPVASFGTEWLKPLIAFGSFYNFAACAWGHPDLPRKPSCPTCADCKRLGQGTMKINHMAVKEMPRGK